MLSRYITTIKGLSVHPTTLPTPEAVHVVDIRHFASVIENLFDDVLLPPPSGIYACGTVEPAMVSGKDYYTRQGNDMSPMTDVNAATKAIYNEEGVCVINSWWMKNKARMLSNKPFLPYRGIMILEIMIKDQIDCFVSYKPTRADMWQRLSRQFVSQVNNAPFNAYETVGAKLELAYQQLNKQIELLLDNKHWCIHNVVRINTQVQIERCMDYRAYCWEIEHGETFKATRGYTRPAASSDDAWARENMDVLDTFSD